MITLLDVKKSITTIKREKILQSNELFMFDSDLTKKHFEKIKQKHKKLLKK